MQRKFENKTFHLDNNSLILYIGISLSLRISKILNKLSCIQENKFIKKINCIRFVSL